MDHIGDPEVKATFNNYPKDIRKKLLFLRKLILDTASETKGVGAVQETLKWGEPSYLVKNGSTIRLGCKKSNTDQYAIFFHCKTKLVDTFRRLYGDKFKFEGNRAILFNRNDQVAEEELKHCISLSLTYHKIKYLPLLGV